MKAFLQVENGPQAGEKFELARLGSFTIGRSSSNTIQIRDKAVSREHCRIDFDGEFFWLVDSHSHNGTFVNGQRINKCMLYDGDVIAVGHVKLTFSLQQTPPDDFPRAHL